MDPSNISTIPTQTKQTLERVSSCTAQLYNIRQISYATYVHKNRDGNFINTAKGYYGAQTIANYWKGHDVEVLAKDINAFAKKIFRASEECNKNLKTLFPALAFLHTHADKALGSQYAGLLAFENTYQGCDEVVLAIQNLKGKILKVQEDIIECENKKYLETDYAIVEYLLESHSRKLSPEQVGITKYAISYTTSFYYNFCRCLTGEWNWQDKIGDFHKGSFYLGILPFRSSVHDSLEFMRANQITTVMSITEVYENNSGTFQVPIKPIEYENVGIDHFQMPALDFKTLPLDNLEVTIDYMENKLQNGANIYVHCKAGRGRSAEVVIAYLIKYHGKTVQDAFNLVQSQRVQVSLGKERMDTLQKIYEKYNKKVISISDEFEILY